MFNDICQLSIPNLCKMNTSEKLCLQWNDFKDNVISSFGELRDDRDLTDVTLACEDGKQVEAHKIILAASSPVLKDILKRNKHPHPLIYMRGLKSEDLLAIIDFLYLGETNVLQENLDSFLALAEELRLKGLTGTENFGKARGPTKEVEENFASAPIIKRENTKQRETPQDLILTTNSHAVIAAENSSTNANNQDLDDQIKSVMTKTDFKSANGREFLFDCKICGKQAAYNNLRSHVEANHITGFSHACNICGKTSRSRNALRMHKQTYHKIMLQD